MTVELDEFGHVIQSDATERYPSEVILAYQAL